MTQKSRPTIGVFDSGFGGLTVLRALLPLIPSAHFVYLGDSARLPYGSKSRETIARYAVSSAKFLAAQGADVLCIACNTATALAFDEIGDAVSIPVVGVIEPVVRAAERNTPGADVLVLATAATVHSHAYRKACAQRGLKATEMPCPLLVPLVEEGWTEQAVTLDVLRIYLREALAKCRPQAVLLGCTHYPLLARPIASVLRELGSDAVLIDSAEATAREVADTLGVVGDEARPSGPSFHCFATDSVEKFQQLGSLFLGQAIPTVEPVDLGG